MKYLKLLHLRVFHKNRLRGLYEVVTFSLKQVIIIKQKPSWLSRHYFHFVLHRIDNFLSMSVQWRPFCVRHMFCLLLRSQRHDVEENTIWNGVPITSKKVYYQCPPNEIPSSSESNTATKWKVSNLPQNVGHFVKLHNERYRLQRCCL